MSLDRRDLIGNGVDVIVDEDRCLVDGQLLAAGILSETAVIGHEVSKVLVARLCGEQDRTVHQRNVLWHIGQVLELRVHREGDVDHVTLLPLAVDGDIAGRTGDEAYCLAVHADLKVAGLHPAGIAYQQRESPSPRFPP